VDHEPLVTEQIEAAAAFLREFDKADPRIRAMRQAGRGAREGTAGGGPQKGAYPVPVPFLLPGVTA
jgi:hypothetical protein